MRRHARWWDLAIVGAVVILASWFFLPDGCSIAAREVNVDEALELACNAGFPAASTASVIVGLSTPIVAVQPGCVIARQNSIGTAKALPASLVEYEHRGGGAVAAAKNRDFLGPFTARSTLWILLGVFVGGLALNLTPCVYPLIPVTISYFGGRSGVSTRTLAIHGLLYVGGLSVTNSLFGVAAALTGGLMGSALQSPVVHFFVAGVLVFFSTSLFGFWELRLPTSLARVVSRSYEGYFGSLFMGSTLGMVAAPCVGPFVLGLLTWVTSTGSVWLGFPVFFSLSLGLGTPLFFLAVFSGCLDRLPGSGEWLLWIQKVMGWVLVAMAAYFIRPVIPEMVGHVLFAGVFLAGGVHVGWIDGTEAGSRLFSSLRTVAGITGVALALIIMWPGFGAGSGVSWQPYSDRAMAAARYANKPVILSFSAKWCVPCRQLEATTFTNPELVKRARRDFVMIKVDLTNYQDSLRDALLLKYNIKGVPTIVFFDRSGREHSELRIIGYVPPDRVLQSMSRLN